MAGRVSGSMFDGNAALKTETQETAWKRPQHTAAQKRTAPRRGKRVQKQEKPKAAKQPVFKRGTAPVAILGIALAAILLVLILWSHAKLVMVNDEVVSLRGQLASLQEEQTKLEAQYELAYDLQTIESYMISSGEMTRVQPGQTYTLELAEPDKVEVYDNVTLLGRVLQTAQRFKTALADYF